MKRKTPKIKKLNPIERQGSGDIKKRIREGFDIYKRAIKKSKDAKDAPGSALYDLDHAMQERRTQVLLSTVDRFVKYDLLDEWLFLNITTEGYSRLENDYHLLFAASIWILDRLSEKDRDFGELYKLLPNDLDMVYDSLDLPDIWDCCYDSDLISSVEYVLHYRNADIAPFEDDGLDGERVFTSVLSAKNKHHADVPSRQRFEKLMSLIPQEKIDSAVSNFTKYYNAWCDRLFNCMKPLDEKRTVTRDKLNKLREKINVEDAKAKKTIQQIKEEERRKPKKPSKTPFALGVTKMPDLLSDNSAGDFSGNSDPLQSKMDALIERLDRLDDEHEELASELHEQDQEIHQLAYFIRTEGYIERNLCESRYGKEVADAMVKLPTPDPYEMCFALLYLTEQNSDLIWLYGAGRGVILEAAQHLPWAVYEYDELEDIYWEDDEPFAGKPADIPDWYSLDYHDKHDVVPRNLAQIIYEETGCIMPRDMHRYDSCVWALRRYGIRQNKAIAMLYCMTALGNARRIRKPLNFDADYMDFVNSEENNDIIPSKSEPHSAKTEEQKEIERLKAALHAAQRSAEEAKKKLAEQKAAAEAEHRELADLRELLFRGKDDDNDENAPAADESIFPYEVKLDTLVFGGHETWVKALKPKLKGKIRFVSKELVFDISIIRGAEVIWIQTNAIPHKAYNRIVDAARKQNKPVRYFMYASAAKCAEQIAENDRC